MVYPLIKPPVQTSILFHQENHQAHSDHNSCFPPQDPNLHPLFQIPIHTYTWPADTEYQDKYCSSDVRGQRPGTRREPRPTCPSSKMATGQVMSGMWECDKPVKLESQSGGQRLDQLFDPTPMPLVDKHFRGYRYRIDDPIGIITDEEVTKCRKTSEGMEIITTRDEAQDAYTPNYRYKDWVIQSPENIVRQLEMLSPVCRLPEPDLRHWDMYNKIRMHRPSPKVSASPYGTCRVLPIPPITSFNPATDLPPVRSAGHFGKFNNY